MLTMLGVHYRNDNGWLRFKCWFSTLTHKGGTDNNPSACIEIKNAGYFCHSCHRSYPKVVHALHALLRDLSSNDLETEKVVKVLKALDSGQVHAPAGTGKATDADEMFAAYPESFVNSYPPASAFPEAIKFLTKRYVGDALIEQWNIRFDPAEHSRARLSVVIA